MQNSSKHDSVVLCPKCKGLMYINEDKDLQCIICAKILVTEVQFEYDSRAGKIRDNKKKKSWSHMDEDSRVAGAGIWSSGSSDNTTKEVLEYGDAAKLVEDHFMAEAERYLGSKKLQERFRELDKPRESETPEAAEQAVKRVKTLSNGDVAKKTETSGSTLESKEKSLERVAAMIKWGSTP